MTKFLAPGLPCVVLDRLGGLPVVEIGDHAFAGAEMEAVYLPDTLKKIGKYAFYGCEKLKEFHVWSKTTEIGGGIFTGCRSLSNIYLHGDEGGRSGLKDFVTEINERVKVFYYLPDGRGGEYEAARLIFPGYYDEAVENTPARITVSNIHGSGQKYRYCFVDKRLQFDRYDKIFPYEEAEESVLLAAEIALCRLRFPMGLWEGPRLRYESFLKEHLAEILFGLLGDPESFRWVFERFQGLDEQETEKIAREASAGGFAEAAGILTDYRHRMFGREKRPRFQF